MSAMAPATQSVSRRAASANATAERPNRGRRWQGQGGRSRPPTDHVESRTPDNDAAVLQSRIEKLEKAIEVLGEENPEAQWLLEALRKAGSQATLSPIGVRLDSCQAFVERARKRLAAGALSE